MRRNGEHDRRGRFAHRRALDRDLEALAELGIPPTRTVAEWLAHPTALDELAAVVLYGVDIIQISQLRRVEAAKLHARLDELDDAEQRRIARADAIRARLAELAA